jgi:hypothetical protein
VHAFILSPYSWKAYGIRLNLSGLCNIGKIFHHLPWGYPPVVDFWDWSAKMCIFFAVSFTPNSSTPCRPLFGALIPGKPMASGLTYQVFVILARFSTTCHGQPSFWDSQPYLHWA